MDAYSAKINQYGKPAIRNLIKKAQPRVDCWNKTETKFKIPAAVRSTSSAKDQSISRNGKNQKKSPKTALNRIRPKSVDMREP